MKYGSECEQIMDHGLYSLQPHSDDKGENLTGFILIDSFGSKLKKFHNVSLFLH